MDARGRWRIGSSCDRQQAYAALRAVLHVLRDRLPTDAVLGVGADAGAAAWTDVEGLAASLGLIEYKEPNRLRGRRLKPLAACLSARAEGCMEIVVGVLSERVDENEAKKVLEHLPWSLR
jgi:uncharacterized protein (DUF2267 family)